MNSEDMILGLFNPTSYNDVKVALDKIESKVVIYTKDKKGMEKCLIQTYKDLCMMDKEDVEVDITGESVEFSTDGESIFDSLEEDLRIEATEFGEMFQVIFNDVALNPVNSESEFSSQTQMFMLGFFKNYYGGM